MKCKICGGSSSRTLVCREGYRISNFKMQLFRCRNCDITFLYPIPKSLNEYYFERYYERPGLLTKFLTSLRVRKFAKEKKGRTLDIGCGSGFFLEIMNKRDWECHGTEISDKAFEYLRKIKGIKFYNKPAEKINFEKDFFDLITLWHVLEHVENPNKALKAVHRSLSKNGLLFIAIPNIDSLQSRLGRCNWFHLDLPRHLYHFSPKSITYLLEKNNFRIEKIKHFSLEYNPFGYVQTFYNMIGVDFNFLYKTMKKIKPKINFGKSLYSISATIILLPFFAAASLCMSFIESFLSRGGTIGVYARKISKK